MYYNMLLPLTQILFTSTQKYAQTGSSREPTTASPKQQMHLYQLSSQQNQLMSDNNPIKQEGSFPGLLELLQEARQHFFKKLKYFITANSQTCPQITKFVREGYGFLLISQQDQPDILSPLIQQTFNCSYQQFSRQATRYGFTIRSKIQSNKRISLFLSKERLIDNSQYKGSGQDEQDLWSESEDEFPNEKELEAVQKNKEEKSKSAFVKSKIVLNKTHSQGNAGFSEFKREDASIEVKLEQQKNLSTPLVRQSKPQLQPETIQEHIKFQEICPLSLSDRLNLEKQNFEKCSRLIDGTIFELLEAYRSKQIQQRQEPLMEKIVEIYDLLSNAIQNGTSMVRALSARQSKSEDRNDDQ